MKSRSGLVATDRYKIVNPNEGDPSWFIIEKG